jgi:hypothetical protein
VRLGLRLARVFHLGTCFAKTYTYVVTEHVRYIGHKGARAGEEKRRGKQGSRAGPTSARFLSLSPRRDWLAGAIPFGTVDTLGGNTPSTPY